MSCDAERSSQMYGVSPDESDVANMHSSQATLATVLQMMPLQTQVRGVLQASSSSASGLPSSGFWSYSHLPPHKTHRYK